MECALFLKFRPMRPASKRELENFRKWKENPTPKMKFILLYGSLTWGIPAGVIAYFITISLNGEAFDIAQMLLKTIIFMIVGVLFGNFMYKGKLKRFEELKDQL